MVDPKVEGAGEDNNNGDKGKRKMEFPSDTSKEIPAVSPSELKSSELNEVKSLNQGSEQSDAKPGAEESSQQTEWDDPMVLELEKLIISNLKDAFQSAIKKIVERGYTEEQAEWAVLNSGIYHGNNDITSNTVNGALALLAFKKDFDTSKNPIFDGLESLAVFVMLEMVNVLKELKPFITVAEAMWLLLLSDLNMIHAVEGDTQQHQFSIQENPVKCSCCTARLSQLRIETPRGTAPQSSETSHICEFSISGKQSSVTLPAMEGTSSGISRASGAGNRKGSSAYSMKDLLRQKATTRCEKGNKGHKGKGKGFFKTRVTTSVDVTVGKPLNSQPCPSGGKNKGSSFKITSKGEIVSTLPVVSSKAPAVLKQESKPTVKAPSNIPASSSAVPGNNAGYLPMTEKDEMIVSLMLRKQQLQKEVQDWTDWANVKVRQAAQKLSKDQAELRMLRQEREEVENFQKGMAVMDENTMKRHSEVVHGLSNVDSQMEAANSAIRRLEAERAMLMKGLEDSKLNSVNSSKNLQEAKVREQEVLKQCRTMEMETSFLQGELAGLKGEGANLQAQIEKARRRQNEFEALRQHEEREKTKFLRQAESLKSETKQLMHQAKVEEDNMKAKAEVNRLKMEERINKPNAEISALKLAPSGDNSGKGGLKRERECAMCLTEEKSIVFLPCAHQVLCKDCNVLHEQKGMTDCPTCRTPIMKRISARFVPPKAH